MRHHLFTVGRSSHRALLLFRPPRLCPSHPAPAPTCEPYNTSSCQQRLSGRGRVEFSNLTRKKPSGSFRMSTVDTSSPSSQVQEPFSFGPYRIGLEEVFLTTKLSFAFVNLRPVVPGHVLVCPKRVVARFGDLSADEVTDLLLTAQRVGEKVEHFFNGSSLTISIQDGPEAGQTVPHVHVHILPRKQADFKKNDEIYDEIDKKEKELEKSLNLDEERKDRTPEVMHEEAAKLRALF